MKGTNNLNKDVRISEITHRHLLTGAAHFGCSMGTLLDMLLDAVRIAEMPATESPKVLAAIERFERHLSIINIAEQNYLFKD